MNYEIIEALGRIIREKNVDREVLLETLSVGLVSAGKKRFGQSADIVVDIDQEHGSFDIRLRKAVVETVNDAAAEISLDEARGSDPAAAVGGVVEFPLDVAQFGRGAIQAAKQVFVQRVREAERDRVFQDYTGRVGEVVSGSVQQVERGRVVVGLGRAEAVLPARESIPGEQIRQGDTIRALIVDVQRAAKGPQIVLSRAAPEFLRQLFESEVPEIDEGIVEIKVIAREAGGRSKVAVWSREDRVDPVGACVGMKGSRVQSVVRELNGERIDIVPWSNDPIVFVQRALSPAKVTQVQVLEAEKTMRVVVANDQLSLAIGRGGQNARLAAKLVGWKIDLVSQEEWQQQRERDQRTRVPLERLPGLGPKLAEKLVAAGLETAQDVLDAKFDDILAIPGVGPVSAEKVVAIARVAQREAHRLEEERSLAESIERARIAARGEEEPAAATAVEEEAEVAEPVSAAGGEDGRGEAAHE